MNFCTVINCMDGRVQLPVIKYLQKRFDAEHVDSITEPGPNLILAKQSNVDIVESVFNRLKISVEKHASVGIAVAAHYDCAGNSATEQEQTEHTLDAIKCIKLRYPDIETIGLWVNENCQVSEIAMD